MQTTINVTLGGKIFHVEEPGYKKLKAYLDGLRAHFATNPDGAEIVADIEQAIADHMAERLKPGKEVITETDVDDMIKQMGGAEEMSPDTEAPEPDQPDTTETPRRLYRDRDRAMLSGVSAGLGAFFGIDPILFRIAFVIATISGGWGILVYILLWIVVPEAKTVSDKMKMSGAPITVAGIEETATAMFSRAKKVAQTSSEHSSSALKTFGQGLEDLIRGLWRLTRTLLGFSFLVGSAAGVVLVAVAGAILLFRFDRLITDPIAQDVFAQVNTQLFVVFAAGVLLIPLLFGIMLGTSLLHERNAFKPIAVLSALALWIVALSGLSIVAVDIIPNIKRLEAQQLADYPVHTRTFNESGFTRIDVSSNFEVQIIRDDNYSIVAQANEPTFNQLEIVQRGEDLVIHRNSDNCFWFCTGRKVELTITTPILEQLDISGLGKVTVSGFDNESLATNIEGGTSVDFDKLTTNNFTLEASGYSHITLNGSATTADITLNGVVNFDGSDFVIESTYLDTEGATDVKLYTEHLRGQASGVSKVRVMNDIDKQNLNNFTVSPSSQLLTSE